MIDIKPDTCEILLNMCKMTDEELIVIGTHSIAIFVV